MSARGLSRREGADNVVASALIHGAVIAEVGLPLLQGLRESYQDYRTVVLSDARIAPHI